MARRFIVGTDTLSKVEEDQFIAFIKEQNVAWWHWLPNFWLIKDSMNKVSAGALADALPGRCLVMEIYEDIDWMARGGQNAAGKKFWDWLQKTWPEKPHTS
jgi:hypothetical protein